MPTRDVLKGELVAAMAGVCPDIGYALSWRVWVDDFLTDEDSQYVLGTLIQRFRRMGTPGNGYSPKELLRTYLSALEREFTDWRSHTEKVLDCHVGLAVPSATSDVSWYWKKSHEALFSARGGKAPSSVPPEGVRLLPLVFKDVCELENFLNREFEQLHSKIVNDADLVKAERVISCIERGCAKLALSLTSWEPNLSDLRILRLNKLGRRNASGYASASEEIFRKFLKSLPSDLYSELARDLKRIDDVLNTYTPLPIDRSGVNESSLRNDIYTDAWGEVG